MSNEDASKILDHLVSEMEKNGYGEIVSQVKASLEEGFENQNSDIRGREDIDSRYQLRHYMTTSISILGNLSSHRLEDDTFTIWEKLPERNLRGFQVELINGEIQKLEKLPDYRQLIRSIQSIYNEIREEL